MTLKTEIESLTDDEPIIGAVIGSYYPYGQDHNVDCAEQWAGWHVIAPLLDFEYDDSHGGQDCPPVYAWTENWLIVSATYDGSTWVTRVPRNPAHCRPEFIGG
jgi:hypothetical protein